MISNDLEFNFPHPMLNPIVETNPRKFYIDLHWIGCRRDEFIEHFALQETEENITMQSLRGKVRIDDFLNFFGATFEDAIERWDGLKFCHEYRLETGNPDHYCDVGTLISFYQEISRGNKPELVRLAVIEHY